MVKSCKTTYKYNLYQSPLEYSTIKLFKEHNNTEGTWNTELLSFSFWKLAFCNNLSHNSNSPSDEDDDPAAGDLRRYFLLAASFEGFRNSAFESKLSFAFESIRPNSKPRGTKSKKKTALPIKNWAQNRRKLLKTYIIEINNNHTNHKKTYMKPNTRVYAFTHTKTQRIE